MRTFDPQKPPFSILKADLGEAYDADAIFDLFQNLIAQLRQAQLSLADVINFNAITEKTQAAAPTVPSGELYIWNDSNAASGQPTHFLMYNQGGTTVTFASVEVAP